MTDKQIMDDVDVSGCEHLTEIQGCWLSTCDYLKHKGNITSKVCKYNPNCYFKQLARKTQECEELKKEIINKNEKIKELRFSVSDLTNRLCYLNAEKSFRIVDLEQALDEIAAHYQKVIKNITTYDDSYDASISIEALHNISDIINKAKGEE